MLCLYVQAPFAVFRTFTAGDFRPTAAFITPSAAYGLLLNVAGIEMRHDDPALPMTVLRSGLPPTRLALGALSMATQHSVFQQLHNYPIGKDAGKLYIGGAKGRKYQISPGSRSFLGGVRAYICADGNDELERKIRRGLAVPATNRYGLPFLGDNNFLVDKLEIVDQRQPAFWFEQIDEEPEDGVRPGTTRLSIMIDRSNMAQSSSALFAPIDHPSIHVPEKAWVDLRYQ